MDRRFIRKVGESHSHYEARVIRESRDPMAGSSQGSAPPSWYIKGVGIGVLGVVFGLVGFQAPVVGVLVVLFLVVQLWRQKVAEHTGSIWIACTATGWIARIYTWVWFG